MNAGLRCCLLVSSLLATTATAMAAEPAEQGTAAQAKPTAHNHRGPKRLMLENAEGAVITLWKPDLTTQPLQPKQGGITLPSTGMNSYHAVIAEKDWGRLKETVIRYEYLHGPPSKHSPSELAGALKSDFEIVPAPIPREHYRYLSAHRWGFLVRLKGQPLTHIPLVLETAHGTRLQGVTDSRGYAAFRLPDDFPDVVPGERDRRSAEFAVSASTTADGITYESVLTASYGVDPAHWQSSPLGWAVVGIGFIAGGLLGRQRNQGGQAA